MGGGPSGAACAYWLAEAGHDVVIVEKKTFPRVKTCGDGLTPGRSSSSTTWAWPTCWPATTASRACARSPSGGRWSCEWPDRPGYPPPRLRHHPPRPRPAGGRAGREGRRHRVAGRRGPRAADGGGRAAGRAGEGQGRRRAARGPGHATWWSPTGPTPASGGRWAPSATARTPGHGHPGLLHVAPSRGAVDRVAPRRARPGRQRPARLRVDLPGGRRPGERRHRPAVHVQPVEGGQHLPAHGGLRGLRPGVLGHLARDVVRAAHRRAPAHGAGRGAVGRGRRGWHGRRRRAPSTRSTARASPTPTRPGGRRPTRLGTALATGDAMALQALRGQAAGRVRPVLQAWPGRS